ncbi:ABC transporter permease subunit [Bacillus mangrovi]|uniref:ABC transporter permease subunit n=1 Tax=Metabacillus mangrovi TaxID=1491830 RepID=A0A7X2V6I3_9BACI|nr:ABC transporter permease [Metabacillus mangrovi]MTH55500.1 ABC transporter permease subunit [Metabacillus mangrovi]
MFLKIYLKEMKDMLRDQRTLLLGVLVPILVLTGLTLFYEKMMNDSNVNLTLAVSEELPQEEKALLDGTKNVTVKGFADPEKAVSDGKAQAAVLLDARFSEKISKGEQAEAALFGDSFSKNSSQLMMIVQEKLTAYKDSVVSSRLQNENINPVIITPFEITTKEMIQQQDQAAVGIGILSTLLPMIITMSIVSGAYPAASDLFAGEKDRKTMEALLMTPVSRTKVLLAKWLTVSSIALLSGLVAVTVVILEITFMTTELKNALQFGDQTGMVIGIILLSSLVFAMLMSALQMLASLISKSVKEAQSYQTPIMMLPILPVFALTSLGVNEITAQHYFIPVLNLNVLIKEMLNGIYRLESVLLTVGTTAACLIIILALTVFLFKQDRWVMGK